MLPLLNDKFVSQLLLLLFHDLQGFPGLGVELDLSLGFLPSILDLLLGHKNFLDHLHKNDKGISKGEKESE